MKVAVLGFTTLLRVDGGERLSLEVRMFGKDSRALDDGDDDERTVMHVMSDEVIARMRVSGVFDITGIQKNN